MHPAVEQLGRLVSCLYSVFPVFYVKKINEIIFFSQFHTSFFFQVVQKSCFMELPIHNMNIFSMLLGFNLKVKNLLRKTIFFVEL